jgi:hypothetical protein
MMFHLLPERLDCLVMALEEICSVEFGWACDLKNNLLVHLEAVAVEVVVWIPNN